MAIACRNNQHDRIHIIIDSAFEASDVSEVFIMIGSDINRIDQCSFFEKTIIMMDVRHLFGRMFIDKFHDISRLILKTHSGQILLMEKLYIHQSIFLPYVDFAKSSLFTPYRGDTYIKPKELCAFTHAHNDEFMLKIWESHYGKLVGYDNLYVIDHGSNITPKNYLMPSTNVISIPKNETDHVNISRYCAYFQRFLLTQYQWVIHVDSDELIVHRHGTAGFKSMIREITGDSIIRPAHSYDVVHDYHNEPILNPNNSISMQRNRIKNLETYDKPALCSMPATWGPGFHYAIEDSKAMHQEDLYLIHVGYADIAQIIERGQKWKSIQQSNEDRLHSTQTWRPSDIDEAMSFVDTYFLDGSFEMYSWMKGMF